MNTGDVESGDGPPMGHKKAAAGDRAELEESARYWDAYYRSEQYRRQWHMDLPSPELMCLLAAGVVGPCRALDIGCGAGTEAVWLVLRSFDVTAVDVSQAALALTLRLAASKGVKVRTVQALAHQTGLPDRGFDFINDRSCFDILAPTSTLLSRYVSEVARVLKPEGVLFIRRLGHQEVDRATFENAFRDDFHLGSIQETRVFIPQTATRIAIMRRRSS